MIPFICISKNERTVILDIKLMNIWGWEEEEIGVWRTAQGFEVFHFLLCTVLTKYIHYFMKINSLPVLSCMLFRPCFIFQ